MEQEFTRGMTPKSIKRILRRETNKWIGSINSELLREQVKKDLIVTGGSIASMLMGDKVNDYDLYFKTKETCIALAEYYLTMFKADPPERLKDDTDIMSRLRVIAKEDRVNIIVQSSGAISSDAEGEYEYFERYDVGDQSEEFIDSVIQSAKERKEKDKKYKPVFISANAITLSGQIQIITRFFGDITEIHKNFDFYHCMCAWDYHTGQLLLPEKSLTSLMSRELLYQNSRYPICAMIRIRKYLKRGFFINAGQMFKISWDINKLDLNNFSVLEDQLTGVDTAYFAEVLALLEEKLGKKEVDETYLMQLIDKIF